MAEVKEQFKVLSREIVLDFLRHLGNQPEVVGNKQEYARVVEEMLNRSNVEMLRRFSARLTWGKYKGLTVMEIFPRDPGYVVGYLATSTDAMSFAPAAALEAKSMRQAMESNSVLRDRVAILMAELDRRQ